ncbi:MAG: DUF3098 domain-containing protein [Bacteroidales bacterium]|nr:DUF3098 domain-containing protein [Bacteroidales bacterium]MBQ1885837.1 DUF3098 domain-containing protein [Bacteroidales bacterium]MBR2135286.1 DUF3098 domain-containing protein [Bacteroidales bacterium]
MADNNNFALPKKNLIWMVLGFGVMVLGFVLLAGGGSSDPSSFSPQIFSARRLYVAPVVILLGCALVVFAIMHKGKNNKNS